MPQRKSKPEPPVMTWLKAAPVLAAAVVFDALRFMFDWFVFFGPAILGAGTSAAVGGGIIGTVLGTGVAGAVSAAGSPVFEVFGVIMSMAVGLFGWMAIGLWLLVGNRRIFRENAGNSLWFLAGLAVSEVPFINTFPAFTGSVWRIYHTQIKKEKAAHAQWKKENAEILQRERAEQRAQMQAAQAAEVTQEMAYAEAESNAQYAQEAGNPA